MSEREPTVQPVSNVRERIASELYEIHREQAEGETGYSFKPWAALSNAGRDEHYEQADRILQAVGTPATVQPQDDNGELWAWLEHRMGLASVKVWEEIGLNWDRGSFYDAVKEAAAQEKQ